MGKILTGVLLIAAIAGIGFWLNSLSGAADPKCRFSTRVTDTEGHFKGTIKCEGEYGPETAG